MDDRKTTTISRIFPDQQIAFKDSAFRVPNIYSNPAHYPINTVLVFCPPLAAQAEIGELLKSPNWTHVSRLSLRVGALVPVEEDLVPPVESDQVLKPIDDDVFEHHFISGSSSH